MTARRIALWKDDLFLAHDTGRHPESADRLRKIHARLEGSPVWAHCDPQPLATIDRSLVERVHPASMLKAIDRVCSQGGGRLDPDTVASRSSQEVALTAAACAVAAVDAVVKGSFQRAMGLIRPPGTTRWCRARWGFVCTTTSRSRRPTPGRHSGWIGC